MTTSGNDRHPCLARRSLFAALAVYGALLLTGCPSNLDELLDKSRIDSASVSPNPVPAPSAGQPSRFGLRVNFDSNGYSDVLRTYARDPSRNGEWYQFSQDAPCVGGGFDTGGCGIGTKTVECTSALDHPSESLRTLRCGDFQQGLLRVAPGTHRFRVDIIPRCGDLSISCAKEPHDTIELDVQIL